MNNLDEFKHLILTKVEAQKIKKSKLLEKIKGKYYPGYASADFVFYSRQVDKAFNELVEEKRIVYAKGEPVCLVKVEAE